MRMIGNNKVNVRSYPQDLKHKNALL